jgi:retinol dehydrogenase-12
MSAIKKIVRLTSAEDLVNIYKTNLTGKVVIVTGSNSGIGLETARVLSSVGAKVIIPCRTLEKSDGAIKEIKKTVPNADLVPMQLDLSDLASIKAFAQGFLLLDLPLHILINNAGIMACPKSFTKDGFETQFGVNHLGHFFLTQLLTDKIKASAPSRIVIVSSSGNSQFLSDSGIDFDNLNAEKKNYSPNITYGQSKLANIYHAKELQRRFDAEGVDVTVTSLHPGYISTNLTRHFNLSAFWDIICNMNLRRTEFVPFKTIPVGASTNVFCAISPDVVKGEFYSDNAVNTSVLNKKANDAACAKRLWEISEKLLAEKTQNL